MAMLEINVDSITGASEILSTAINQFKTSISKFELNINCSDEEVKNAINNYYNDKIKKDLNDFTNKLETYVSLIGKATDLLKKADSDNKKEIDTSITIPKGFDGVHKIGSKSGKEKDKTGIVPTDLKPQGYIEITGEDGHKYRVATDTSGNIYIQDENGMTKSLYVGNHHLGGVVYQDGKLTVPTGSNLTTYNFNDLLKLTSSTQIPSNMGTTSNGGLSGGNNQTGSISFTGKTANGDIIGGQFHKDGHSEYGKNGGASSDLVTYIYDDETGGYKQKGRIIVPENMTEIQGCCSVDYKGKEVYALTSSWGTSNDVDGAHSEMYLAVAEPTINGGTTLRQISTKDLPLGAEQVSVTENGKLAVTFEGKGNSETIQYYDIDTLLSGIDI